MKEIDTNTKQPLVSVIMPTYNHAQFIGEAIDSVLNQTYRNFELIIVDNYSDDDTEKKVTSYKNSRIKYFKFRNNGMIAASRNFGVKNAFGEYLAFLDSDDLWFPERLAKQVPLLDKNPEIGLVFGNGALKDIRAVSFPILPKTFFEIATPVRGWAFSKLVFEDFHIPLSSVLVRSGCFKRLGNFLEIPIVDDYHKWLQISLHYHIDFVDDVIFEYTFHGKNISYDRLKKLESLLIVFDNLIGATSDIKITRILHKRRLQIEFRLALAQIHHGVLSLLKNLNTSRNGFSKIQRLVYLEQVIYDKLKSLVMPILNKLKK